MGRLNAYLTADPTVQAFCERPAYLNHAGKHLVDFWGRQEDREALLILGAEKPAIGANKCCPVHGEMLEITCRTCGAQAPYWRIVALLDAPYRCGSFGHLYGASPPTSCRTSVHSTRRRASLLRDCVSATPRTFDRPSAFLCPRCRPQIADKFSFLRNFADKFTFHSPSI